MAIDPITVTLTEPVTHNKTTYSEIKFTRTARGRDLVAMDLVQGDTRKSFALFASLAEVPIQVFLDMSMDDYADVAKAAVPFMGKSAKKAMEEAGA